MTENYQKSENKDVVNTKVCILNTGNRRLTAWRQTT